ncbi:hypothetical protein JYK00_06175 [Thermosipho ferrireducens]|uniref:Glycosyltransferase RgtA/B/C/D-like domain-containing protein n=1 Tax=Thermosipho ferrireducens TaxID=2571116 RepID=A0ABX7S6E3_9BACT|nr:hypothetical protein [Thermosipho ferrireducens]QTA37325.1 hypothetical protein JYK00_06175 [Thermosipho ferrireducens]
MSFFLFSIGSAIVLYIITKSFYYFFLIALGLYYLWRQNSRLETFLSLTFVLMMALSFLSRVNGYKPSGLNFLFYGSFLSVLYDLSKKVIWSIPFFATIGIGISMIGAIKYGNMGYLFGLLIIPVFLRELTIKRGEHVESSDFSRRFRKKNEI